MLEIFESKMELYFGECSPALVNLIMTIKRGEGWPFDKIDFYYLPGTFQDKFPFKVLFFEKNENRTSDAIQIRSLEIPIKIIYQLPGVLNYDSQFLHIESIILDDGSEMDIEIAIFKSLCSHLKQLVENLFVISPTFVAQLHDSEEEIFLN